METFTLLFTDIEGSTALVRRLGPGLYARVLTDPHGLIRSGLAAHGGEEVDTQGDALFAVFSSPRACLVAVLEMQRAVEKQVWPGGGAGADGRACRGGGADGHGPGGRGGAPCRLGGRGRVRGAGVVVGGGGRVGAWRVCAGVSLADLGCTG